MEYPEEITVTIPAQKYDDDKYWSSSDTRCYLEQALDDAGYPGSKVGIYGRVVFNRDYNLLYNTTTTFSRLTVKSALDKGKSLTVTLKLYKRVFS